VVLWYIFPHFGMLYQEKSGNPVWKHGANPTTSEANPTIVSYNASAAKIY
jgi:hypothetical protein